MTVLIPDTVAAAIEIYEQSAALRMAIVERVGVGALGAEWDRPGLYVLLDRHSTDGLWASYVGKAPAAIRVRLLQHASNKDHWSRAVLIQRDTTHGFNSVQVAWLEGRVYDLLSAAQDAVLHNKNRPGDETLPAFERTALEASIEPIVRVLRLVGFDTSTPEEHPSLVHTAKTAAFHGVTIQEVMAAVHKAAAIMITAALTLSVTACGATAPPGPHVTTPTAVKTTTAATPTPSTTASHGATVPITADNPLGYNWAAIPPFTGPAVDKFGAANVMNAYRHAVEFSLIQGYTNLMVKGYEAKPIEFGFVGPYLTASAQKRWATQVLAATTNHRDKKAFSSVFSLTAWNAGSVVSIQEPYTFRKGQVEGTDGTYAFSPGNPTVTVVTVAGQVALVLRFKVTRNLRVMKGDRAVLLPLKRDIAYQMVPNGLKDHPWLIDSWLTKSSIGKATPDPQGTTG